MAQSATTIYLGEGQRQKLFKLAATRKVSFSSEIRMAIDRYVDQADAAVSDTEGQMLVLQANESIDRMAKALDEAHQAVARILKSPRRRQK